MDLDPEDLKLWLEWAGARLLAMPGNKIKPQEPKALWLKYTQDPRDLDLNEFKGTLRFRALAPSSIEIPIVDEILILPNLCSEVRTRKILHSRLLVNPLNGRYLFPWTRIAKLLQTDRRKVVSWHSKGLIEVSGKIDE